MIKGARDFATQSNRYAKLYFGLNCDFQECVVPKGLHMIPIPFMRQDHGIIRFRKIIPSDNYSGEKIRLDQELKRLKKIKLSLEGKPDTALVMLTDTYVNMLSYISEGPYDPNRG